MLSFCAYKKFNDFCVDASFSVDKGEFVALFGASGAGKSTILRLLAGFERADFGASKKGEVIYFNHKKLKNADISSFDKAPILNTKEIFLAPQKRNIGFLFQDYALFSNMSVLKNLLYAKNDKNYAEFLLDLCDLNGHKNALPNELSGGQKQRVALVRALMRRPELLLLDEPFSALDYGLKSRLQDYLLKIHQNLKPTIIMVSHDLSEVYKLAKRVLIVSNGKITQNGSPTEIFMPNKGSQKLNVIGKILELKDEGAVIIAVVEIANRLGQIALSPQEAKGLKVCDEVIISVKAFKANIKKL